MALALDGEVAAVNGADDRDSLGHVLRRRGTQDAPWLQSGFLKGPVRGLGGIVHGLPGETDFRAEGLVKSVTLGEC